MLAVVSPSLQAVLWAVAVVLALVGAVRAARTNEPLLWIGLAIAVGAFIFFLIALDAAGN